MRSMIEEVTDRELCLGRRGYVGFDTAFYQDGSYRVNFVTVTSSGIKKEGDRISALFATRELAEDAFDREIRAFIAAYPGTYILWRMKPTAERQILHESWPTNKNGQVVLEPHEYWYVVSRLAVSVKPPKLGPQEEL